MINTNCLEGLRCPKCAQEDRLLINAIVTCDVTDNGSEPVDENHFWNDLSLTTCPKCDYFGQLKEFYITSQSLTIVMHGMGYRLGIRDEKTT